MDTVSSSIISRILHLKQTIEKSMDDEYRLIYCLKKLDKLPIEEEHLRESVIGISVTPLCGYDGRIGVMATDLMNKWNDIISKTTFETENWDDPPIIEAKDEKDSEQMML